MTDGKKVSKCFLPLKFKITMATVLLDKAYFLVLFNLGSRVINITIPLAITNAYSAGCFSGHSPIKQVETKI
jgi:hypothetical protein